MQQWWHWVNDRSKVLIHFLCDYEFFQLERFLNYHFILNFSQLRPTDGAARIFPTTLCHDWESNSRRNRVAAFSEGPMLKRWYIDLQTLFKPITIQNRKYFQNVKAYRDSNPRLRITTEGHESLVSGLGQRCHLPFSSLSNDWTERSKIAVSTTLATLANCWL